MEETRGIQNLLTRGDGMQRKWSEEGKSATICYQGDQKVEAMVRCYGIL
jgi:hypothetical protein